MVVMFFIVGGVTLAAENLALDKSASQSSEEPKYKDRGWSADKAVDGNMDGDIWKGSVIYTSAENQPWWQVDLGAVYDFDKISIWNRTDGNGGSLSDFYIFVSDKNVNLAHTKMEDMLDDPDVSAYYVAQAGTQIDIEEEFSGRFVRIQLKPDNIRLNLAEVEVWTDYQPICGVACTEEVLAAEYKKGEKAGKKSCTKDPESCGIEVSASLSPGLDLHIPELQYNSPFGSMRFWADLKFIGEKNGDLLWKLSDYEER